MPLSLGPRALALAERLERALGDPHLPESAFSFAQSLRLDEREEFPEPLIAPLRDFGYLRHFVPASLGGELRSFEEGALLQRLVSRRDLTVAIALGQSFLGTVPVWLAGSAAQQRRAADLLFEGHLAALALTEEEHGSDVLASEVRAVPHGDGYSLSGRKWLINNGTRGSALSVFARTDEAGGLNGFSLFFLERDGTFEPLAKKRTHGIRGADISGISFVGTEASSDAIVGPRGSGAELVLKALQVTRVGCSAFSLGAADTALRLALDFAVERKLYGSPVIELPHARAVLTGAFLDLLTAECAATAALRAVQSAPEQLPLWSAAVKVLVPALCDRAIREAALVLGARHYLREGPFAVFQKLLRDSAVVSLFDGSAAVCLEGVGLQLTRLSAQRAAPEVERTAALRSIFSLNEELPPIDGARFELANAGRDDLTQGLAASVSALTGEAATLGQELLGHLDALAAQVAALERRKRSPELFELSRRYTSLYAAACCVHLAAHNRQGNSDWLPLCLDRLLAPFRPPAAPREHPLSESATQRMLALHRDHKLFSLRPVRLGG